MVICMYESTSKHCRAHKAQLKIFATQTPRPDGKWTVQAMPKITVLQSSKQLLQELCLAQHAVGDDDKQQHSPHNSQGCIREKA